MPILSEQDKDQLRTIFENELQDPLTIRYFTRSASKLIVPGRPQQEECAYCGPTQELLEEIVTLSKQISLEVYDLAAQPQKASEYKVTRVPAIILEGRNRGTVRYFGIPAGYEFAGVVEDLIDLSKGSTDLDGATKQALGDIQQDVHIQVFTTPT